MAYYDYRISTLATAAAGSGTITVTQFSNGVSGASTAFLTQTKAGDIILYAGQIVGTVSSVLDNTTLLLNVISPIGVPGGSLYTIDPMVNVENLVKTYNQSAPKGDYQPWSVVLPTGDALARGLGRPTAQWRWNFSPTGFISDALRDALRVYCTGKSARVYIRTRTFESTDKFVTFQAAMLWPDKEDRDFKGVRKGFVIEFRDLIPI